MRSTFSVIIEVGDPQGRRFVAVEALVDTGASDTALPEALLRALGVQPLTRRLYRLANGTRVMRDVGQTMVRIAGSQRVVSVVFEPAQIDRQGRPLPFMPLIGASTLEVFGLGVDPSGEQLIPVEGHLRWEAPEETTRLEQEVESLIMEVLENAQGQKAAPPMVE